MLRQVLVVVGLCTGLLCAPLSAPARTQAPVWQQMRLISYYPAHDGWTYMWERWKPAEIDRDFALIAGLDATTVRIFVQPSAFGFPRPSPAARAKLDRVLALAGRHGLTVELTLFDWFGDYGDVAGSERWASALLARHAGDPRLAAVELRNEIDPYDPAAVAWARQLLPYLRTVVPGVPVTLSVSAHDPIGRLTALSRALAPVAPDYWSFHYYDKAEYAYWTLAAARAAVAPVPLVLAETGYEPSMSIPEPRTREARDAEQVRFIRTMMDATALLGLPPAGLWVLLDFGRDGSPVRMPAAEYSFGLFRSDRTPKPAAAAVRAAFAAPGTVDAGFDGDFEQPGLASWRVSGRGAVVRDTASVHGGSGAAEIVGAGSGATNLTTIPPDPWVAPGLPVTLSAWACGEAATGTARIAIRWFAGDRTRLGESVSTPLPDGTTGWTRLSVHASAPPGAAFLSVALETRGNTGAVRFDDVTLAAGA